MQQTNAIITVNPRRLDRPLEPLHARRLHSFAAEFIGIPEDCYAVILRIFTGANSGYFDIPVGLAPDGGSSAYLIGTCFPSVGTFRYEIHAYDASGNATALGAGDVVVDEFSASAAPIEPDEPIVVAQIPDANGVMHSITAVPDGVGGYTTIVSD